MKNYQITTSLNVTPTTNSCCLYTNIVRGSTAELTLDFNTYSYLKPSDADLKAGNWDEYIEQITFLFKWGTKKPVAYQLYNKDGSMNSHFSYDLELNYLSFIFTSCETAEMELANADDPVQFEIAIKADTDKLIGQEIDSVIIEKQMPIVVSDSLYRESGLYVNNCGGPKYVK